MMEKYRNHILVGIMAFFFFGLSFWCFLKPEEDFSNEAIRDALLKRSFSSLRMLLEYAAMRGVKVESIVLPILGTGLQLLSVAEVAGPLVKQLFYAMETIDTLSSITICEYAPEKARELADIVGKMVTPLEQASPDVFISYSSKQIGEALDIRNRLTAAGISCWMAPESTRTRCSEQS